MPPLRKYSESDIINCAYEIARCEGMNSINARRIAKELNCSVQPIFHNFSSMDDLKRSVYEKIYQKYQEYMLSGKSKKSPYKEMGISYIKFAKDYPEFFKTIFMQSTKLDAEGFIMADNFGDDVVEEGRLVTGFTYEEQKKFHVRVWIFTHGIACLVATNTIKISDEEIGSLLEETVREMVLGFKREENK